MRWLWVVFASLLACSKVAAQLADGGDPSSVDATTPPVPTARGCSKDSECKDNGVCASGECRAPAFFRLDVVGATIGPGKLDGTTWDGVGRVPQDLFAELQRCLQQASKLNYEKALIEFAAHAAQAAVEKPDPFGTVEIDRGSGSFGEEQRLGNNGGPWKGSFTPIWRPTASWQHVAIRDRLIVRVVIFDKDLKNHDAIGSVNLTIQDLDAVVARRGQVTYVPVAKQSGGQLLYVHMAAVPE